MKKVRYQGTEYIVADRTDEGLVLLKGDSIVEYELAGVDTEESMLKFDENIHKTYPNGNEVIYIIDDLTGLGVGYYGIMEDDEELEQI